MESSTQNKGVRAPQPATAPAVAQSVSKRPKSSKKNLASIVVALVVVLAVVVLVWFGWRQFGGSAGSIDRNKYQAVFLTNGQVYFGKLQNKSGNWLTLSDIFYLQASNAAADNESENPQEANRASGDVQLIKLGTEVHGPTDEMVISRDQVLFFENLKEDGNVSESIKQYNDTQAE